MIIGQFYPFHSESWSLTKPRKCHGVSNNRQSLKPWTSNCTESYFLGRQASQIMSLTLQRRHNERDGISNHGPHDCLLKRLFRHRSKKTSKPRVTGLCEGNSPVTGEFPAQGASNTENVSIWWRHHEWQDHRPQATSGKYFQNCNILSNECHTLITYVLGQHCNYWI